MYVERGRVGGCGKGFSREWSCGTNLQKSVTAGTHSRFVMERGLCACLCRGGGKPLGHNSPALSLSMGFAWCVCPRLSGPIVPKLVV